MAKKLFLKTLGGMAAWESQSQIRKSFVPPAKADKSTIRKRAIIFFSVVGLGSLFQYGYGWALYYFGGYSYPYTSPFFLPEDRFMDFFNTAFCHEPGKDNTYPAFLLLFAKGLGQLIDFSQGRLSGRFSLNGRLLLWATVAMYLTCLLWISKQVLALIVSELDSRSKRFVIFSGIFTAITISYPSLFAIDRGNYVLVGFVFLCLFLVCEKKLWWSGLFLATGISIKQYLAVLIVPIFLKRYRMLGIVTCCFILLENLVAALILSNDGNSFLNYLFSFYRPGFYNNWNLIQKMEWNSHLVNVFYSALFPMLKKIYGLEFALKAIPWIERLYLVFVFLPGVIIFPILVSKKTNDLKLALCYCTIIAIVFTPFSGNYGLIYLFLFVPILLSQNNRVAGNITIVLLALVLVPKHYITLLFYAKMRVTLQSIINPLILLAMLCHFVWPLNEIYSRLRGKNCCLVEF